MEAVVISSAKGQDECYLWRGLWKHLLATHPQVAGEKTTEAIGRQSSELIPNGLGEAT